MIWREGEISLPDYRAGKRILTRVQRLSQRALVSYLVSYKRYTLLRTKATPPTHFHHVAAVASLSLMILKLFNVIVAHHSLLGNVLIASICQMRRTTSWSLNPHYSGSAMTAVKYRNATRISISQICQWSWCFRSSSIRFWVWNAY